MIAEFLQAQRDQFERIEAIDQDMQHTLIGLERGMTDLVDGPWRTALARIQEAADNPRDLTEMLTGAHESLLEAYGMSRDNLRHSWIAQDLAAVYALSGDFRNVRRWLAMAYASGLKGVKDQLWRAAEVIESETETHAPAYKSYLEQRSRARSGRDMPRVPHELCSVDFRDEMIISGPRPFKKAGWYGSLADATIVRGIVQGLERLFHDLAQLRRTCIGAGIDQRDLPQPYEPDEGGIRVASFVSGADFDTLAYFNTSLPYGPQFSTDWAIDVGIELDTFCYIYIRYSI
jgi:hypothetical protein